MQQETTAPPRGFRRLHWNQDYADAAMGIALTALAFLTSWQDQVRLDAVSVPLLVLQTLPIAWRRRDPNRCLFMTGVAITAYSLLGYRVSSSFLGVLVAFYTVAANETRRRAAIAAAVSVVGIAISFAAYATLGSMPGWKEDFTTTCLSFGLAWLIGDNLRVRRAYTRELENRAVELEREREEKAAQAVTEERTRIARELHDVVAHYVSVMVVQAAGARRVVDTDPKAAKSALGAVESAGRTALTEMRRMLEVLRADDPGMGPQPGLGDLERLIDHVRDAGLPVDLSIEGEACCLPAGMDLAAYRIVQEALTNTVKHGGKATARVVVRYAPDMLEIEVVDDGRGAAAPLLAAADGRGHGLIGMKERVALFGGVLETGPVLTGGYRVFARMSLDPDDIARARSDRAALAAPDEAAARERREHAHRAASRYASPVKPRAVPPMMVRVVPPHSRPQGRREMEGDL
ncbi:MAG: sensor histidine kinase [Candidatus Limnocylindrales bacterium]